MYGWNDDPHPRLRSNSTPAAILYGECDFVPWDSVIDYRLTLKNAKLYYFPQAGHTIDYDRPQELAALIRDFLLDREPAMPAYTGVRDPRPPPPPFSGIK